MKNKALLVYFPALIATTTFIIGSGQLEPNTTHIQHSNNGIEKYNKWHMKDLYYTIKPTTKNIYSMLCDVSDSTLHSMINNHAYKQQKAFVRFTAQDDIGEKEKLYLDQRDHHTHQALQSFLKDDTLTKSQQPRIAMCFSGGGFRAMILTLGFLIAAHDNGLLDCTTYMSGLSGSTWLMAPWIASKKDLHWLRDTLETKIGNGLHHLNYHKDQRKVVKKLFTKVWYRQFTSAMDIYGPLLANTLLTDLGKKKMSATLSHSHEHIIQGQYPMPIYTCIETNYRPYEWFEFTPFEMGSSSVGAYIPTWAYGRKFKNGESVDYAPEQSIGYCMGIFGSAFEVDIEDVVRLNANNIKEYKSNLPHSIHNPLDTIIDKLVNSPLNNVRLAPSMLPYFGYKKEGNAAAHCKMLSLIDAGLDFNLPFAPLLRAAREVDIIIVYDSSGGTIGSEIKKAALYAQRKGIKFPPVPDDVGSKLCSVLKDPNDASCPIVIYMPRIKNEAYSTAFDPEECTKNGYCNTNNFTYSQANIGELSGLAEFSCHQHLDTIKQVIADGAQRKKY